METANQDKIRRIVLASRSPRRLQLLRELGFDPLVHPADVDEVRRFDEMPGDYTRRLSHSKAAVVAADHALIANESVSPWVVSADTVVVVDSNTLEKPVDRADAARMLRRLSGRWHTVITSFSVGRLGNPRMIVTETVPANVHFKRLTDDEIDGYLATNEPMDKAGAYGIQAIGSFLVKEIRGSYFTVVGLPVCELIDVLKKTGAFSRFPFPPSKEAAA